MHHYVIGTGYSDDYIAQTLESDDLFTEDEFAELLKLAVRDQAAHQATFDPDHFLDPHDIPIALMRIDKRFRPLLVDVYLDIAPSDPSLREFAGLPQIDD